MYYLIRVKDGGGGSMIGSFDLPDDNAFDHDMQLILTRKQTKEVKANPQKFKFIAKSSPFDYLDLYGMTASRDEIKAIIEEHPDFQGNSEEAKVSFSLPSFFELRMALQRSDNIDTK